jgi:hypothetical protein
LERAHAAQLERVSLLHVPLTLRMQSSVQRMANICCSGEAATTRRVLACLVEFACMRS